MNYKSVVFTLIVVSIWGLNPAISKLGMLDIPPFAFLSMRYFFTAALFLPFANLRKEHIKVIFFASLFSNVVTNGIFYIAFNYLTPTASTLLMQVDAPLAIVIGCLFGKESFSILKVLGIVVSLIGVIVILGLPEINLIGAFMIIIARLAWGFAQLLYKSTKEIDSPTFTVYAALFALPVMVVLSLISENEVFTKITSVPLTSLIPQMFFQVVLMSYVAMTGWQRLIARYGMNKIAPFSVLRIAFGILGGVLLFGDVITTQVVFGIALISIGVLLSTTELKIDRKFSYDKKIQIQ